MLPKGPYNPKENEKAILDFWLNKKFYKPEYNPSLRKVVTTEEMKRDKRKTFCLICPPPNSYARPHIGNISGYSYQDVFARKARMDGKKVLMIPGKDHAAQEAEVIYIRDVLSKLGKRKEDYTREEFYNNCYKYFKGMTTIAQQDEKTIGLSADFDRDIFTLDPRISKVIINTFLKLYKDGMIYKDVRIVNWSPGMKSVVPDIETEHKERETDMVYIKYPLEDKTGFIEVATTRPETMLGDTAIVVDPTDKRYTKLIGKYAILPLVDRRIPIIANGRVDKEFGTGAVKLTPAHSGDDYTIMLEWNYKKDFKNMPKNVTTAREAIGEVGYINVINRELKMVGPIDKYKGLYVKQAREEVVKDLQKLGLVTKIEKITQNALICSRSKAVIEPLMSSQWFIDVDRLKAPAIKAINNGDVIIHPKSMSNKMLNWLENLRDWPISRSIWWGYRFPVWYKGEVTENTNDNGKIIQKIGDVEITDMKDAVDKELMKVQLENPGEGWIQDNDVFDTWFSSGQWPYATLMAENLMDTFYPTQVMEMAYGILELWCSRMIMLGLYVTGKVPFKDAYIQGHIKAADGRKMSKSLGNVVNIDDLVAKYGVDAVRLFYIVGNKAGVDYRVDNEKLEGFKRFINKIWNASKFVLMNLEGVQSKQELILNDIKLDTNRKFIDHLNDIIEKTTKRVEHFNIGVAAQELFESFWHIFCDQYIEDSKKYLYEIKDKVTGEITSSPKPEEKAETQLVLRYVLKTYMELLHPFIPFITEIIWKELPKDKDAPESIMYTSWPK